MKIRRCLRFAVLLQLCVFSPAANAQSYDALWKKAGKAQQSGLPRTAVKYAEDIFRKAEAEKNSAQMLKAYTARASYRRQIAPDSFYVDLKGLEQWASTSAIAADRAVLHTLIAQVYSDYARRNRWSLSGRTDVADASLEEMREWSSDMFVRKTLGHTRLALEDPLLLSGLSSGKYIPFVEQQPTSRYFDHTMYHLLSFCGIRSLRAVAPPDNDSVVVEAIAEIYSDLNRMYRRQNNSEALALLALDSLEWRKAGGGISPDAYRESLDGLIEAYGGREICAEVCLSKARDLIGQNKKAEALRICRDAELKYPKYERINALKELREEILRPALSVNMKALAYPEDTLLLNASHVNLDGFTVHYYKVDLPVTSPALQGAIDEEFYKKHARKVRTERFSLVRPADYLQKDTVFRSVAPGEGIYAVQIVPDGRNASAVGRLLSVASLQLLSLGLPEQRFEAIVLDAVSGQPVEDATVHLFTSGAEGLALARLVRTHANGRVELPWNDDYRYITAGKGDGPCMLPQRLYRGYYGFADVKRGENRNLKLLTDRSVYRPGQTVYVKGIAYSQLSDTAHVVAGKKYTLALLDANGREISREELTTNEFGSFATGFVLPSGGLNGNYTLRPDEGTSVSVRVEEYKRPTFEVTMERREGAYRLNDSINVKGSAKTYSGIPVQGSPVRYVVTRRLSGWRGQLYDTDTPVASGSVPLNDAGEFTLPVVLRAGDKPGSDPGRGFYTFTVSATVTHVMGETQTSTATFNVGDRSLLLSADVPGRINKEEDIKVTFGATNLSREPVEVEGSYRLYRFSDYAAKTLDPDPACTGTFTSNAETMLPEWNSLPTGVYKLALTACDERGREAGYETETILFSAGDKRPVENVGLWYYPVNTDFDASHPGEFIFGTSEKEAYILMDVFSGNRRLESRSLHLSDSVMRFTYPYKPEYGDGLTVAFCYVKAGKACTQNVTLRKRLPEKELKLSWSVFRDKLRPGQQEEWKLTIKNPDGSFADAELLATLYDASLDRIWKRPQSLRVAYPLAVPSAAWWFYRTTTSYYDSFGFKRKALKYPPIAYDFFRTEACGQVSIITGYGFPSRSLMAGERSKVADAALSATAPETVFNRIETEGLDLPAAPDILRTDFAETAFFYPRLRTNENGEAVIAFTLPESLTRWNFNGYAHTKGMLSGMINSEAVASKEFMLAPGLPRFVRTGDHTSVAASVANLTGHLLSGQVVLTLFDPSTEKVIATQKQPFTAGAGQTAGVDFMFTATDKYSLLGCRLVAEAGSFSDGEQHLLPVLSHKERVVETVAMPVRGNETREFPLDNLFNNNSKTATGRSLTIEFSGNPVWYAVQALPALSLPAGDNAVSWATAYYANALAAYIMNSHPRLKAMFDAWKKQEGTKETFLSNLQKNREVKDILLEESPWVMEAITEQERKERLATLFDLNNVRDNTTSALNKLKDLQLSTGAWTWYKGMPASRYITAYVMQSLVRLKALTGQSLDPDADAMYRRTLAYLHREALKEYADIRKAGQKGAEPRGVSADALRYLYIIALSGEPVPEANEAAYRYFLDRTKETIADRSVNEKALAAVILQKSGHTSDARAFIASLEEYATRTDELGMFFASDEDPYSWAGLRVPAHVAVMEAFDIVGGHSDAVEEMKLWLLKEKQARQWNSPVATANAVYALLYRGADPVKDQGDVRITLGDKTIRTLSPATSAIPGMAYVRETITDNRTLLKARKVVVGKRDAGIAWGAVYAGYEEDADKVASHGEGLSIGKKLYVERIAGDKKELLPVASGAPLKVGDKVVSRITIRLDRAMDFVQLKDRRAACLEPVNALSGYAWGAGTGYYVAVKDASTHFYFDALDKGVYVLEHSYRVDRTGSYESGAATVQSAYAPEYASHAPSVKLIIDSWK
jgi:hypothetical protein